MQTKRIEKSKLPNSYLIAAVLPLLAFSAGGADYQSTVLGDAPKAYYRLNDDTSRTLINKNSGTLGVAGNATNDLVAFGGVVHPMPGAIVGDPDRAEFFDFTTRTEIPFNPALNTPNTQPFTVETWIYPVSDQVGNGMGVLANRFVRVNGSDNRQGWVVYQRAPDTNHCTSCGPGVGWNFRMYDDLSTSTRLDITSQAPFQLGKWQHVVVVYDPVQVSNATLTIYIDGVQANQVVWNGGASGTAPGYGPCTGTHDAVNAPNGQPAMALGGYNNSNPGGNDGDANPWIGGIDEFAWYNTKLTAAQILAHYQNATNANRTTPYDVLVKSLNPVAYLRLNEIAPGSDIAVNLGDVRSSGIATNTAEVRHPATGALVGRSSSGAFAYHTGNGNASTTLPWLTQNNGQDPLNPSVNSAGIPFTFETWLRPMRDQQGGQCPVNNRSVGGTGRTGWVIFQRNPNLSYPASEGHGWNFRMYSGAGSGGQDVLTDTDYSIGKWQHLVFTWQPQVDNGDVAGNGNDQWQGILTAYVDGMAVASNTSALYAANRQIPEAGVNSASGGAPADLAIGSYNAASGLGSNPYEGDVSELAIYNNYVLTPDQILAHYQAGTNANFGTNYASLVENAAAASIPPVTITERVTLPATYLRFNDPARYPLANSGSLGSSAGGEIVLTANTAAGPQSPAFAGFESTNAALQLDGLKQWASFNNPSGLNLSGQITLEAWVKPDATQGNVARIISHGPPTKTDFLSSAVFPDFSVTNTSEVFLRLDGAGANYSVGSTVVNYTNNTDVSSNTYSASFAVPAGDLGGGSWVHLAGTYDGANWRLYRNGRQVSSSAAAIGALPVINGDWAVGATGNGWADNYTGAIDEVAVYSSALSARQIATHYVIGRAGTTALTTTRSGNTVTITWPAGTTLQQSTAVNGSYADVPGSPTSPLSVSPSGTKFYRWRL